MGLWKDIGGILMFMRMCKNYFRVEKILKKNKTLFLDDQKKNKKNPVCGWQFKVSLHKTPFFPLKFLLQESDFFWNFLPLNSEINVVFYSYFHIFVDTWFLRNPELNMNLHFWCHNSLYYIGKQNCEVKKSSGQNTSQT